MKGNETISDWSAPNLFNHFKSGDLSLKIKPRSESLFVVDYNAVKKNPTHQHLNNFKRANFTEECNYIMH